MDSSLKLGPPASPSDPHDSGDTESKFAAVLLSREEFPEVIDSLKNWLTKDPTKQIHSVQLSGKAVLSIQEAGRGFILFNITSKSDFTEILNLLIQLRVLIQKNRVRIFGFNGFEPNKTTGILMKKGCTEILSPTMNLRTLTYKIERWISIVDKSWDSQKETLENRKIGTVSKKVKVKAASTANRELKWTAPLTLKSDFWTLKQKQDVKSVRAHWLIELVGPPPSFGKWQSLKKDQWKWVSNPETDTLCPLGPAEGNWVFQGRIPEFSWKNLKWRFTSKSPYLAFEIPGNPPVFRFRADLSNLLIAENSEAAAIHLIEIEKALSAEVTFKGESDSASLDADFEVDAPIDFKDLRLVGRNSKLPGFRSSNPNADTGKKIGTRFGGILRPKPNAFPRSSAVERRTYKKTGHFSETVTRKSGTKGKASSLGLGSLETETTLREDGGILTLVEFLDLVDQQVIVRTQDKQFELNQLYSLNLTAKSDQTQVAYASQARIIRLEADSDDNWILTLELLDKIPAKLLETQRVFLSYQARITDFLRRASGKAESNEEITLEALLDYFTEASVCIVDPSGASRTHLAKLLIGLGLPEESLTQFDNYTEAFTEIPLLEPEIVFVEQALGKLSGLDLCEELHRKLGLGGSPLIILTTCDGSTNTVVRAAEEAISGFILKPYEEKDLLSILTESLKKDPSSTGEAEASSELYHYHLAQAQIKSNHLTEAILSYEEALKLNPQHYCSLNGLYQLYISEKRHDQALSILERLHHIYPGNPVRLAGFFRLAIVLEKYEAIDTHYLAFQNIKSPSDELLRCVCAALITTGKHYLQEGESEKGLELLTEAVYICRAQVKYFRKVIEVLFEFRHFDNAKKLLKEFPLEAEKGVDYLTCRYMVLDHFGDAEASIQVGRQLIKTGAIDFRIYEILIKRLIETGQQVLADECIEQLGKIGSKKA